MIASKIKKYAAAAAEFRVFNFGIEEVMVDSKILNSATAAVEFVI